MAGFFVSFEGVEGSGKSTQVGILGSKLREAGYNIVAVREPGGTRIGEAIRSITHAQENVDLTAVAEVYLMAASRAQLVREIIRPTLDDGKIVIADRYVDSTLAYQGYGRGLGLESVMMLNKLALDEVMPDLTVFLDLSPVDGFKRRGTTDKIDRLDLQQKDFYMRVYEGYKKLSSEYSARYVTIDSSKSIEEVASHIWEEVSKRLPAK